MLSRLPAKRAEVARKIGLGLALLFRIALLFAIFWIIGLKEPVQFFKETFQLELLWRDIILIGGGMFLLFKATHEIHNCLEGPDKKESSALQASFAMVIFQIILIDMVFSIDSIITAVGIAKHIEVMIAAVVISMFVMYFASVGISHFIERHPTTKLLALSFLLLIGVALIADGFGQHIPRGYIYFSMAFAAGVEFIHILARGRSKKVA